MHGSLSKDSSRAHNRTPIENPTSILTMDLLCIILVATHVPAPPNVCLGKPLGFLLDCVVLRCHR